MLLLVWSIANLLFEKSSFRYTTSKQYFSFSPSRMERKKKNKDTRKLEARQGEIFSFHESPESVLWQSYCPIIILKKSEMPNKNYELLVEHNYLLID